MPESALKAERARVASVSQTKSRIREYIEAGLVALVAALLLRTFVVGAFRIPTGSMKDTLLIGDFLLVNKFIYGVRTPDGIPFLDISIPHWILPGFKAPERGEVFVFKYPQDEKLDYIKRCIAAGGQSVEVREGLAYVDGQPEGTSEFLKKEFDPQEGHYINYYKITTPRGQVYTIRHYADHSLERENFGPVQVPAGHFFMMGDNRDNSADSRFWGFLPRDNVVGEAMVIYWSWDKDEPIYRIWSKVRWERIGNLIK